VAVTGLSNGVSYLFRVAAINRLGMGFDALGPNAITPATTPFAPTGVTAAVSGSTISLNWTAPESNGGSPIVNYTVYYRNTRTTKWSILSRPASTATSAVARLSRNASYVFRVAAINGVGASPFSGISNVATL
jgi:hypothetical protein